MHIIEQTPKRFRGTHKGCDIAIDLDEDTDPEFEHGLFYSLGLVRWNGDCPKLGVDIQVRQ